MDTNEKYEVLYKATEALVDQLKGLTYGDLIELGMLSAVVDAHKALLPLLKRGEEMARAAEARLTGGLNEEECALVRAGERLLAIKTYRGRVRPPDGGMLSLKECMDAVDRYRAQIGR